MNRIPDVDGTCVPFLRYSLGSQLSLRRMGLRRPHRFLIPSLYERSIRCYVLHVPDGVASSWKHSPVWTKSFKEEIQRMLVLVDDTKDKMLSTSPPPTPPQCLVTNIYRGTYMEP